tara:strand:+ start:1655 stop:3244 length:1590 start_codon:yes stop_codon:yes gene_type:complete
MKPDFRKSMIWLHTYSGLVLGWLLFTIFLTGTLSYFNPEITQWMQPERQNVATSKNTINRSLAMLHDKGENADRWRIYLPNERTQKWGLQWSDGRDRHSLDLGAQVGSVISPRETAGGNFFRVFHYTLHLRGYGGRYIAGIAAMFMLVAVFSGIFTHRRFFRDFFTLRTGKLQKTLTDFHALAGVVTIPFCIMICASGIMIYVIMYMPWSAEHYAGGERQLSRALSPNLSPVVAARTAPVPSASTPESSLAFTSTLGTNTQPLRDFSAIQAQVDKQWTGQNQIDVITFEQPYSETGRVIVQRVNEHTLSYQTQRLVFSAHTGQALTGYPPVSTAANVRRVFFGLHEAHFADTGLRWLLFLLGLISTALIGTGLVIWLNKRLAKVRKRHAGHTIVERLNIAALCGLPLAISAYFLGNRLIPIAIENRAALEVQVFLWVWLGCLLHSVIRAPRRAWEEQLFTIALLCLLLPLVDVYQEHTRLLEALVSGNIIYIGFCLCILTCGVISLKTAFWLRAKSSLGAATKGQKTCC